ncbi:MAG TPA: FAD-dependent oxidoreductase [Pseudolabrys sp.]|nr:FAD-dependent oxidoreductase [Pseudolabrys sp.]
MASLASLWTASESVGRIATSRLGDEVSAEIAIIGAGFTGLAAALHAAEGGADTVLLEAESIGFGASGRNGGQVNPGLKHGEAALAARFGEAGRCFYRMGQEAPDFLGDLVARKNLRCHFARPGLIRLAHNAAAMKTIEEAADAMTKEGIAVELLSRDDVQSRVGTVRYVGGLRDARGGSVHPLELALELARVAQESGVRIFSASPATSLTRAGDRWRIATPSGAVMARKVVVATNAYTDALVPGLAASVLPVNSFQIATAPLAQSVDILPGNEMVYDSRRLVLYFRRSPDNRVVLGGRASFLSGRSTSAQVADYSVLEGVLLGIFPQLKGVAIDYRWTGLVGITFDYLPHYHVLADDLHVMLGYNGRGVALANRAGAWLGRKLTGQADPHDIPAVPIKAIPFHRFRSTLLNVGMQWNRVLDLIGR